jgi:large conductance mechanosensitive channel
MISLDPSRVRKESSTVFKEFKDFALKGNVVDLAVGVIIGAAFGKIVASLVEDVILPPIGKIVGNLDFSSLYLPLSDKITPGISLVEAKKLGPVLAWGNFLTVALNFLIVAICIFMLVKLFQRLRLEKRAEPPAPAPPTREEILLSEIRDLLKAK